MTTLDDENEINSCSNIVCYIQEYFWGRMLVRSPILTIAFRPHVDICSCTVEHIKMLHLYPIFHHMCCKVSGFMVDLEAEW